jgi:hypothetical protein
MTRLRRARPSLGAGSSASSIRSKTATFPVRGGNDIGDAMADLVTQVLPCCGPCK